MERVHFCGNDSGWGLGEREGMEDSSEGRRPGALEVGVLMIKAEGDTIGVMRKGSLHLYHRERESHT